MILIYLESSPRKRVKIVSIVGAIRLTVTQATALNVHDFHLEKKLGL